MPHTFRWVIEETPDVNCIYDPREGFNFQAKKAESIKTSREYLEGEGSDAEAAPKPVSALGVYRCFIHSWSNFGIFLTVG